MSVRAGASMLSALFLLCACESAKNTDRRPASLNERFERLVEDEHLRIDQIRDGILFLQRKQAGTSGRLLRGTHAKGICASAEFKVNPLTDLDPSIAGRLRQGAFAAPGTYPARIRFANADGAILPDQEPDVRAASFSVELPQELGGTAGLMDFAMNDAPTFPINDASVFGDLMILAKDGLALGGLRVGVFGLLAVRKAFQLGAAQKRPPTEGYQKLRYWSGVPFALGQDEAVKYSLKPCATNASKALTADPDTLSKELVRHLNEDAPGCFDFQVQLLEAGRMKDSSGRQRTEQEWVENPTWEWPEDQAPFFTVARLTLKKTPEVSPEECEAWRIDVINHSTPTHRGLGSINRARASAEQGSAEARR